MGGVCQLSLNLFIHRRSAAVPRPESLSNRKQGLLHNQILFCCRGKLFVVASFLLLLFHAQANLVYAIFSVSRLKSLSNRKQALLFCSCHFYFCKFTLTLLAGKESHVLVIFSFTVTSTSKSCVRNFSLQIFPHALPSVTDVE